MFCTNCGNRIEPGQLFCTGCGTRVAGNVQNTVNYSTPQTQASYGVVRVLTAQKKLSMFNMITCYVVLFNDRMVLAHITPEFQKAESARKSAEIKASGTGFFKGSAEMMRFWSYYHKKYETMSPPAILAECPMNMEIPYNMISQLLFRAYEEGDEDSSSSGGDFNISLSNGNVIKLKHKLGHSNALNNDLQSLLGFRLKYKK